MDIICDDINCLRNHDGICNTDPNIDYPCCSYTVCTDIP
jgi:hypothetical protein